jgi:hypothetical protein
MLTIVVSASALLAGLATATLVVWPKRVINATSMAQNAREDLLNFHRSICIRVLSITATLGLIPVIVRRENDGSDFAQLVLHLAVMAISLRATYLIVAFVKQEDQLAPATVVRT